MNITDCFLPHKYSIIKKSKDIPHWIELFNVRYCHSLKLAAKQKCWSMVSKACRRYTITIPGYMPLDVQIDNTRISASKVRLKYHFDVRINSMVKYWWEIIIKINAICWIWFMFNKIYIQKNVEHFRFLFQFASEIQSFWTTYIKSLFLWRKHLQEDHLGREKVVAHRYFTPGK